jgi:glutathione reductase (NADPH)
MTRFDVLILGGGNAGIGAAVPARAAGLSVAIVEGRDMGGTCPNRGCTPKKVLVAAAHALHEIEQASVHRITVGAPRLDWAALIDREMELIRDIPSNLERAMQKRGIALIRGDAVFTGPNSVRVGDRELEAAAIVIATGSKPRPLPIPGAEHMTTSDELLSERKRPSSIVFVGGGVIALEFGHVFARAGSQVTILEALPRLLPAADADAVARLQAESERIGIRIETGVTIARIEPSASGFRAIVERDGAAFPVDAECIVNGAGRVANVDTLNLATANVRHDQGRIVLDRFLRSVSNPAVYVCGDAVPNSPQLSPVATYEGRIVGRNIVGGPQHAPDYASLPTAVYTVPALSAVGLTEHAAREQGRRIKVRTNDMLGWLSARTYAETVAWSKIIIDESDDSILGAHFVGHSGEELVNIFALAIAHRLTAQQIRDQIYAYPTFSSDIKNLL